jgi:hypothetical protein
MLPPTSFISSLLLQVAVIIASDDIIIRIHVERLLMLKRKTRLTKSE